MSGSSQAECREFEPPHPLSIGSRHDGRPRRERDTGEQPDDGTRLFDIEGRFDPPPRIIAVWDGSDYEVEAGHSVTSVRVGRRRSEILQVLRKQGEARLGEILDRWPGDLKPSSKTVNRDLSDLVRQGQAEIVRELAEPTAHGSTRPAPRLACPAEMSASSGS